MSRKRRFLTTLALVAGAVAIAISAVGRRFAAPRYRGPESDHFDGERFHNLELPEEHGPLALLRWMATRDQGRWTRRMDLATGPAPERRNRPGELKVTFVNHATVLIQVDGLNILTDPIWSGRCSPVSWGGPSRFRPPGIRFEDLPTIDAVIISHNHYDHLDLPTIERLHEAHNPLFLVPLGNARLLAKTGVRRVAELDWEQSHPVSDRVTAHCLRARHFSGRGLGDRNANLWSAWLLEAPGGSVYFAGDTGWGSHFAEVRERFGPPRVALLPIGAYRPRWFMCPVHISPDEAVKAHRTLGARASIPIHYGTFALGDDGQDEPSIALAEAVREQGLNEREFVILAEGESLDIPGEV